MAGLILEIDAAASNPDGTNPGTALLLTDAANGWTFAPGAGAFDPGTAEPEYQYASSVDTEGSLPVSGKHQNRTVTIQLHIAKASAALLRTALDTLGQKIAKIFREGGTLKLTLPDASVRIFDLVGGDHGLAFNKRFVNSILAEITLRLPARPYMRVAEAQQADRVETTLPCLIATETGIAGDASALTRWVADNDGTIDWWGLRWATETNKDYAFTDSTGSGALFYEAETRLAMGGSATAAGPSGASGAGSNVMRNTALATTPQAVMSTASSGGTHLTHVGEFFVCARVQVPTSNTGTVSLALEYGVGDFRRFTRLDTRTLLPTGEGTWKFVEFGLATIPKVLTGPQRWEARILAWSTVAGDDIDIDCIFLFPSDVASGIFEAVPQVAAATSFSARDEFDQSAGNLTGKALPVGGTWTFASGDTDDFTIDTTNKWAQRVTTADTAPRLIYAPTPTLTATVAQVGFNHPSPVGAVNVAVYVVFRWVDASNYAYLTVDNFNFGSSLTSISMVKVIAGVTTFVVTPTRVAPYWGAWKTLRVVALATGDFTASLFTQGAASAEATVSGADAVFVTGGTLASGKVGFGDQYSGGSAITRAYDNFAAWAPAPDAGIFAGQSAQIRWDGVIREDSTGTYWQPVSSHIGDNLRIPPAGAEARSNRFIAKPLYHQEESLGVRLDDRIDDISGRVNVTGRYWT